MVSLVLTLTLLFGQLLQGPSAASSDGRHSPGRNSPLPGPSRPLPDEQAAAGLCEPAPETFEISSLGLVYTNDGSAGYLIDKPGSYIVVNDLQVENLRFGIHITSPDVTLDLGGHTLEDLGNVVSLIRVSRPRNVTVRNGRLLGGQFSFGGAGCGGESGHTRLGTGLLLEKLTIETADQPILIGCTNDVDLHENRFTGGVAVQIHETSRARVVDNWIEGDDHGLLLEGDHAVVSGNTIIGHTSVTGSANLIQDNHVRGGAYVKDRWNRILNNEFVATEYYALQVRGTNLIQNNDFHGGTIAGLLVTNSAPRVVGNTFQGGNAGIRVEGSASLVEDNVFQNDGLQCAISYTTSAEHVYRDNHVSPGVELACGEPNIDGGGNSLLAAACEGSACAGAGVTTAHSGRDHASRRAAVKPSCDPIIELSEPRPTTTPYGTAGLLIDQPGHYVLDVDLGLPEATFGVLITASSVILDLNRHTISTESAIAVGVRGSPQVVLRNGNLRGGGTGVSVLGDPQTRHGSLRIENMSIFQGIGLKTEGTARVDIFHSLISGSNEAVIILGRATGRLIGNTIRSNQIGLDIRDFRDGEILDNVISGTEALILGSRNLVRGNTMHSLVLLGHHNRVVRNVIEDWRTTFGVSFGPDASSNLLESNFIGKPVDMRSRYNRLERNTLTKDSSDEYVVSVQGVKQILDDNLIFGGGSGCGVDLLTDSGHVLRENVIVGVSEELCGVISAAPE